MIIGIVAEYNPFHFGHLYQLEQLKNAYDAPIVVCMSGNTVQRGSFSLLDKLDKTKIALHYGIDLVAELPAAFIFQSAKNYAFAALDTLAKLNVTHLAFGLEGDIESLKALATFQVQHEYLLEEIIRTKHTNYHFAMLEALEELGFSTPILKSNDILALEYLKQIEKNYPHIIPIPIPRVGSDYRNSALSNRRFNSATAIRKAYHNKQNIHPFLPEMTWKYLKNKTYHPPTDEQLRMILFYKLFTEKQSLHIISGFEKGLDDRIKKTFSTAETFEEWIARIATKRYRPQRIRRLMGNYLFHITTEIIDQYAKDIPYINILGFRTAGRKILSQAKKNTVLITNHKNLQELTGQDLSLYQYHIRISELFYQKQKILDYYQFPVIND